ncbi:hypothetical protein RclHR1_10150005 [Rhizophagus clarus]|uniref:Uncharacterized protein n=1 Tax=Rhizophagus clarus TaxID=94130 RepID=A0A2Z6QRL1_9GLOM|nr:hypothetical protein RclHR1_10150005 [Rhizophagus clarus]GET02731.1 hypothetical protein GLOIN_2v1807853 [Rhizophagus clarus]
MDSNYNNSNFIDNGFNSDLQSQTTDTQSENPNINYNDANTPYDYNRNSYPITNGDVSSDTLGNVTMSSQSYPTASPQYSTQNAQFIQNNSSPFYITNSSQTFTFDIPGIKIIVIPTFPVTNSTQTNHSEIFTFNIPGYQVIIITLVFQ